MEILFDETYTSKDGQRTSRNIWYGYADISVDGDYGKVLNLDEDLRDHLSKIIIKDLAAKADSPPTETNWYFYGSTVTQDAIGGNIRPTIMVRERKGMFVANLSISDHDFAVNLDAILAFKDDLENRLAGS